MRRHPEIEYVSRDRGNDYAQATREGAPQAIPVADRFHLTKNLVEAIEPLVARCYKELRKAQAPLPALAVPQANEWRQAGDKSAEHQRLTRLANNQERFEQMIDVTSARDFAKGDRKPTGNNSADSPTLDRAWCLERRASLCSVNAYFTRCSAFPSLSCRWHDLRLLGP